MTIEKLKEAFLKSHHENKRIRKVRSCDTPVRIISHKIYNYDALDVLKGELQKIVGDRNDDDDLLDKYAVRYVVDSDGVMWFAKEGPTSSYTPNHGQMRAVVYAAGNLYFDEHYHYITEITNKSGHFKPSPGTLVWAIGALLALNAPLAENIKIQVYDEGITTKRPENLMTMSLDDLKHIMPCPIDELICHDRVALIEETTRDDVILSPAFCANEGITKRGIEGFHTSTPSFSRRPNSFFSSLAASEPSVFSTPPSTPPRYSTPSPS